MDMHLTIALVIFFLILLTPRTLITTDYWQFWWLLRILTTDRLWWLTVLMTDDSDDTDDWQLWRLWLSNWRFWCLATKKVFFRTKCNNFYNSSFLKFRNVYQVGYVEPQVQLDFDSWDETTTGQLAGSKEAIDHCTTTAMVYYSLLLFGGKCIGLQCWQQKKGRCL